MHMTIAILGWGSLISNTGGLSVEMNKWYNDGPVLPIEFARVSNNGRLTLVIYPSGKPVKTYYAVSTLPELNSAIENLAKREGTERWPENIGYMNFITSELKSRILTEPMKQSFQDWNKNKCFDAIIWTDLQDNFQAKTKQPFSLNSSIEYLKSLKGDQFREAKEYILTAPEQTVTNNRPGLTSFLEN